MAFLADQGVNAAEEFAALPLGAVQARVDRIKRNPDWRPRDIVISLRRNPPATTPNGHAGAQRDGPIDVDRYTSGAYGDLFRRGSDTSDLAPLNDEEQEQAAGGCGKALAR